LKRIILSTLLIFSISLTAIAQTAPEFYQVAMQAKAKVDYAGALKLLNKAIDLEPMNQFYLLERGNLYLDLERYGKAKDDFDEAIRIDSMYIDAYIGRSAYFRQVNLIDSALYSASLARILSEDILSESKSKTALGEVYLVDGKDSLALVYFLESLQLDTTNVTGYKKAAQLLSAKDDHLYANEMLRKAYDYDDRDLEILINLAYTSNETEEYREALKFSNMALELDPHHPASLSNRAYAYLHVKQIDLALKDIKKSLANDKSNPMSHRYAGEIYKAKNDDAKACKHFKMAQKLGYELLYGDDLVGLMGGCE